MTWVAGGLLAIGLVLCARYHRWVETAVGAISGGIGLMLLLRAARMEVRDEIPLEGLGKGLSYLGGGLLMVIAFSAVIVGLVDRRRDASRESGTSSD